jgi:hypothetical protein
MGSSKFQAGKEPKDKDKRKGKAASSSATPTPEPKSKRSRKLILHSEDLEEEHNVQMEIAEMVDEMPLQEEIETGPFESNSAKRKPLWDRTKPISSQPADKRGALYLAKMKRLKNNDEMMIVEKRVDVKEFKPFGIVDKFKAMGRMEALTCTYYTYTPMR